LFPYLGGVSDPESSAPPDEFDRLGTAVRELTHAVVRTGSSPAELAAAAEAIEAVTEALTSAPLQHRLHDSPFHPTSLVGGTAHPAGPQLYMEPTETGVSGTVTLGAAYEGGPGLVHGGVLSLLFDHAMGIALFVAGHAAMTVSLEVRYRAPTPLGDPLHVSAHLERQDGRKLFVRASVTVDGAVTAEATAIFVQLTRDNVAQIFPADRVPRDGL
jgi:acyl-coenzyme A thioesterase PaaI-like protein